MLYVPLKLRDVTEPISPKGPSFRWAPRTRFSVDGSVIELRAPRNRGSSYDGPCNPKSSYDLQNIRSYMDNYAADKPEWLALSVMRRIWDFYGPSFTGKQGVASLNVFLLTPRHSENKRSLFHPRAMEGTIAEFLTSIYGDRHSFAGVQDYLAPVDWHPIENFPCGATVFDIVPTPGTAHDNRKRMLVFPVSDCHFICVGVMINRPRIWLKGKDYAEANLDKWVDFKPFERLADQVLDSVRVTLSPKAQAEQQQALEGLSDTALATDFPPLKWPNDKAREAISSAGADSSFDHCKSLSS